MKGFNFRKERNKLRNTVTPVERVLFSHLLTQRFIDKVKEKDGERIVRNVQVAIKTVNSRPKATPKSPRGVMKEERAIRKAARLKAFRTEKQLINNYWKI